MLPQNRYHIRYSKHSMLSSYDNVFDVFLLGLILRNTFVIALTDIEIKFKIFYISVYLWLPEEQILESKYTLL